MAADGDGGRHKLRSAHITADDLATTTQPKHDVIPVARGHPCSGVPECNSYRSKTACRGPASSLLLVFVVRLILRRVVLWRLVRARSAVGAWALLLRSTL